MWLAPPGRACRPRTVIPTVVLHGIGSDAETRRERGHARRGDGPRQQLCGVPRTARDGRADRLDVVAPADPRVVHADLGLRGSRPARARGLDCRAGTIAPRATSRTAVQ